MIFVARVDIILRGNNAIWYQSLMKQIKKLDCKESMRRGPNGKNIYVAENSVYTTYPNNDVIAICLILSMLYFQIWISQANAY